MYCSFVYFLYANYYNYNGLGVHHHFKVNEKKQGEQEEVHQ